MPSPFPGMDPYLEGSFWSPVHHSLAEEILRQLAPRLRPRYVALPEERFVVEIPSPVPLVTVEIHSTDGRRLVTAIEILSPANKSGDGRREYLTKRQKILRSSAHLVEIDLLRRGARVPMEEDLPAAPYFVFVSRAEERPTIDVWPIQLPEALPTVQVPLLPGDSDLELDLQQAFQNIYDLRGFDLLLDYGKLPEVPLEPEDSRWARRFLDVSVG